MPDREFKINITGDASSLTTESHKGAEGLNAAKKAAHEMGIEGHDLHKIIEELTLNFPVLGSALKLLTDPVGGAFVLGTITFIKAKEAIDEWNRSLDESAAKLADPTWLSGIAARKKAIEDANVAFAKFADHLEHLRDSENEWQNDLRDGLALYKEFVAAQRALGEAHHELDATLLENRYKRGLLSAQEYYNQVAQFATRQHNAELDWIRKEDDAQLRTKQAALEHAQHRATSMPFEVGNVRAKATSDAARLAKDEADLADLEKTLQDKKAAMLKTTAAFDEIERRRLSGEASNFELRNYQDLKDKAERATADYTGSLTERDKLAGRVPDERISAASSQAALERMETAAEKNAAAIYDLTDELKSFKEQLAAKESGAAATSSTKNLNAWEANPLGGDFQQASRIQKLIDSHAKVSAEDKRFYDELLHLMSKSPESKAQTIAYMRAMKSKDLTQDAEIKILAHEAQMRADAAKNQIRGAGATGG